MGKILQDDTNEPTRHACNTSPIHKKPLTPTKDHPLMDLEEKKSSKTKLIDDSDDTEDDILVQLEVTKAFEIGAREINTLPIENKNFLSELEDSQETTLFNADETNNNMFQLKRSESTEKLEQPPSDSIIKHTANQSSTNINSSNLDNNNRISHPIVSLDVQQKNEDLLIKTIDKSKSE